MSVQRFSVSLAAFTLLGFARAQQAQSPWYARPMYGTGGYPIGFALADFDRDGRLDVALAHGSNATPYYLTSWLRGTHSGGFGAANLIDVGIQTLYLRAADLDHDGAPDLIATGFPSNTFNYSVGRLAVVLTRGSGTFRAPMVTALDVAGGPFALGDVDEDGELDIVLGGGSRLLRGHGDGTFEPALTLPVGVGSPFELVDLDGDHHLDLGGFNETALATSRGHGDGTFDAVSLTPITAYARGVAYHDFDGDGLCEAVTTRNAPAAPGAPESFVELHPGLGGGAFGPALLLWSGPYAPGLALGDVDDDGRVDVGIPHYIQYFGPDPSGVAWLRSLGGLSFAPGIEIRSGGGTLSALWGDLENDGDLDLVTINDYAKTEVGVVRALRPGVFEDAPKLLDTVGQPVAVAVGDLDGDGRADIAAADRDVARIELWRGNGAGDLQTLPALIGSVPFQDVVLEDFNHDGRADVAAVGSADWIRPGELRIWRSNATGFAAPDVIPLGVGLFGLAAGDLDGDGRVDLAVSFQNEILALHGRANGTFELISTVTMGNDTGSGGDVFIGDYDGDGRNDLAQIPHEEWVWVAYGLGGGHFGAPVSTQIEEHIQLLANGDLDLDGRDDLIVEELDLNPGTLYALWGRADRAFDVAQVITMYWVGAAAIADFNGNGCPDLAAFDGGSLQVLTGDCDRGFDPPRGFGLAQIANKPVVADLDGDGKFDVIAALPIERHVAVLVHH